MVKINKLLGNSRVVVCCKLIFSQTTYNHKVSHVVGSMLINKYIYIYRYTDFSKMRNKFESISECNVTTKF